MGDAGGRDGGNKHDDDDDSIEADNGDDIKDRHLTDCQPPGCLASVSGEHSGGEGQQGDKRCFLRKLS